MVMIRMGPVAWEAQATTATGPVVLVARAVTITARQASVAPLAATMTSARLVAVGEIPMDRPGLTPLPALVV